MSGLQLLQFLSWKNQRQESWGWGVGGGGGYETMKSYILIFKIWTKRGVMKKLLRNRGLVEKGVLLEMVGVSKLFHFLLQFFGFFV